MAYLVSHISLDPRPNGPRNPVHRHRKSSCVCMCRRYTGIDDRCTVLGSVSGVYLVGTKWSEPTMVEIKQSSTLHMNGIVTTTKTTTTMINNSDNNNNNNERQQ